MILGNLTGGSPLPGSATEWTGMFLFAVGLYGASYRETSRHLLLWGALPLDLFYLGLLLSGALLMIVGSPEVRAIQSGQLKTDPPGVWAGVVLGLRGGVGLGLLMLLLWLIVYR